MLGLLLKNIRVMRGLNQAQASKMLGLHACYLCELETGSRNITNGKLDMFAAIYDVPVQVLIDLTTKHKGETKNEFQVTLTKLFIEAIAEDSMH